MVSKKSKKKPVADKVLVGNARRELLRAMTSIVRSRSDYFNALGNQFGGNRDLYTALGWLKEPTYADFLGFYKTTIGSVIINAPCDRTWYKQFEITCPNLEKKTAEAFQKKWNAFAAQVKFYQKVTRLDKLVGIGQYGVLFLGFNDQKAWSEEVERNSSLDLAYITPLGQVSAEIATLEPERQSPRYGKPRTYNLTFEQSSTGEATATTAALNVHWTRVLHVARNKLESEVYGESDLRPVLNNLYDIQKISGGSAEMFWRGAFPGLIFDLDPEIELTPTQKTDMSDQIDDYVHSMRRYLRLQGVKVNELKPQTQDPSQNFDVQIQQISAITRVPKRILTGSERGELASSQDDSHWNDVIAERQTNFAEPEIVRPFLDYMVELGIMDSPGEEYQIAWPDLTARTDKEKAEIALNRAKTLTEYKKSGAEDFVPPEVFLRDFLHYSEEEVNEIIELVKAGSDLEDLLEDDLPEDPFAQPDEDEDEDEDMMDEE